MPRRKALIPRIPAAPFVAWVNAQLEILRRDDTLRAEKADSPACDQALAYRLDITERALYRYKHSLDSGGHSTATFRRHQVEKMLEHAEIPFWELYPEIAAAEDIPLEPDALCRTCDEMVTPLNNRCPWCSRFTTVSEDVLAQARQMRDDGMSFRAIAMELHSSSRYPRAEALADALRAEFRARGWPMDLPMGCCELCGVPFTRVHASQRYCCHAHANKHYRFTHEAA